MVCDTFIYTLPLPVSPANSLKVTSEFAVKRAFNSASEAGTYQDGSDSVFLTPQHKACSSEQSLLVLGQSLVPRSWIKKYEP